MKPFLVLTRLRMLDVLRSKSSATFVLLFPIILLCVVGLTFANGHPFERRGVMLLHPPTWAEDAEIEQAADALSSYEEVVLERTISEDEAFGKLRARMVSAVLLRRDHGAGLALVVGPRDRLFARGIQTALPMAAEIEVLEVPRFGYVHYLFPGLLTFSVLLSGLFGLSYTMVAYRQNQFLKKLASTPLPRSTFIGAQITARAALVMVQVVLLLAVGHLVFGVPLTAESFAWTLLVSALGLLAFLGAGFALACAIRTEDLVVDIVSSVNLPLVLLSEIFFPLSALPKPLAAVGGLLPSTEMVRLTRATMLYETGDLAELGMGLGLLALWAIVTFGVSLAVFKWHG